MRSEGPIGVVRSTVVGKLPNNRGESGQKPAVATLALAPSAQAAELVTTKWSCNGGPVFTITTTPQATSLIQRIYPTVGCRQVG
ncbi:hypothetical protein EDD94_5157 [Streptomyces sp. PanSC9]|nr:hypothetical protein EDD94_5157 [Streptomyces sp. PanSC9]